VGPNPTRMPPVNLSQAVTGERQLGETGAAPRWIAGSRALRPCGTGGTVGVCGDDSWDSGPRGPAVGKLGIVGLKCLGFVVWTDCTCACVGRVVSRHTRGGDVEMDELWIE